MPPMMSVQMECSVVDAMSAMLQYSDETDQSLDDIRRRRARIHQLSRYFRTQFARADDGIRTRDPDLGKVSRSLPDLRRHRESAA